jgi:hypothetical protein
MSHDAEVLRQGNSITNADAITETAFKALKPRYDYVRKLYLPCKAAS